MQIIKTGSVPSIIITIIIMFRWCHDFHKIEDRFPGGPGGIVSPMPLSKMDKELQLLATESETLKKMHDCVKNWAKEIRRSLNPTESGPPEPALPPPPDTYAS